jgi:hypothetical protein
VHTSQLIAPFLDTCRFTRQATQIEQACPADFAAPYNRNGIDTWCMQQECTLNANPMGGDSAYREILIDTTTAAANHHTLKILHTLTATFNNPHTNPYGITNPKLRQAGFELALLNCINNLLSHLFAPTRKKRRDTPVFGLPP